MKKSSVGYNLTQLLIGSEGTLAVITEITLRIIHAPKHLLAAMVAPSPLDKQAKYASMQRYGHTYEH